MRLVFIAASLFCLFPLTVLQASWGDDMFAVKKHNFGIAALGSESVYPFAVENVFLQEVRISGVYSSCGCTAVSVTKNVLKSGEKGAIVAQLNTSGQYLRERAATLTVNLETTVDGQMLQETVQLSVTGYVRPDVVLTPGNVEFGSLSQGKTVTRDVELHYSGKNNWALIKIDRQNPFIYARADEIKRYAGEVFYRISVTLNEKAPAGYIKDILHFTTNETTPGTGTPVEIALPVQGVVTAPLRITPPLFMAGVVAPGDSTAKNIVIRNDVPFKIRSVDAQDERFRFTFSEQESSIQILSVLFTAESAPAESSLLRDTIRIRTNLPEREWITLQTQAFVTRSNGL